MRAAQQAVRDAERRFPVRIRIAAPPEGFGGRLDQVFVWLDAMALYFADVTLASAFVTRWCAAHRAEVVDGTYQVRDNEPTPRMGAGLHKMP